MVDKLVAQTVFVKAMTMAGMQVAKRGSSWGNSWDSKMAGTKVVHWGQRLGSGMEMNWAAWKDSMTELTMVEQMAEH